MPMLSKKSGTISLSQIFMAIYEWVVFRSSKGGGVAIYLKSIYE